MGMNVAAISIPPQSKKKMLKRNFHLLESTIQTNWNIIGLCEIVNTCMTDAAALCRWWERPLITSVSNCVGKESVTAREETEIHCVSNLLQTSST